LEVIGFVSGPLPERLRYLLVKHLPRNCTPQCPQQSMLYEVEAGEH
jgi:hypothetical protein